jgi:hypothetical protein
MALDDVPAWSFGLFNHWLYTQSLDIEGRADRSLEDYLYFYKLAERFQVPSLQATTILKIRLTASDLPHMQLIPRNPLDILRDSQEFACRPDGDVELKNEAIIKTRQQLTTANIDEAFDQMPPQMIPDFARKVADLWLLADRHLRALRETRR